MIGKPAKNISPAFKAAYPNIPWRGIGGTRDRIVHEYVRTKTRRIWDVVEDDIDGLGAVLGRRLNRPPSEPSGDAQQ